MNDRRDTQKQECSESPKTDIPLGELSILALDCQATGATPDKGSLLEIGWVAGCADKPPDIASIQSRLIRQPADTPIAPSISRITGISEKDLRGAVSAKAAWQDLIRAAKRVASQSLLSTCPTAIHYARFERPFLHRLHETQAPGSRFPFQIICTHAIAQRMLPELPRRGIRALAGYFGQAVPELKRSAAHVLATLSIWQNLVKLLQSRCQVYTFDALQHWMAQPFVRRRVKRTFPLHHNIRCAVPDRPGIYRMRRANGDILYIGKAKSLKQRVTSYFRANAAHAEHILEMLTQARDLDFVPTDSALEAAVLESDEIKRHRPPYNIALRPNGRSLIYGTRDLLKWCNRYDRNYCVGPLPAGRAIESVRSLAGWLAHDMSLGNDGLEHIGATIFDFASDTGPSIAAMQEGFKIFHGSHQEMLKHRSALRAVASIGAKLWRQRVINGQGSNSKPDMEDEAAEVPQDEPASWRAEWTPTDVAGVIENVMMHAAHMLRRARWFHLLGNSSLAWASADAPQELRYLLVFEKGAVVDRLASFSGAKPSETQRGGRLRQDRKNIMDLATYERMRVVTTELRRLVSGSRAIELRLSRKIRLTDRELKRALRWV